MAYREIIDGDGVQWTVWDTYPESSQRLVVSDWKLGWLTFESRSERRRLVPAPAAWSEAPDERLREWLGSASGVKLRIAPSVREARTPVPDDADPTLAPSVEQQAILEEDLRAAISRSRETLQRIKRAIEAEGEAGGGGLV